MDIATILGLVIGISTMCWSVAHDHGKAVWYFNPAALAIIVGGITGSVLISFPMSSAKLALKVVKQCFFAKKHNAKKLIEDLVGYAEIARRDGILALENVTKDIPDEFLVKGIQMAVDGLDPDVIEQVMHSELHNLAHRHAKGKAIIAGAAKYGPGYGMIGTLLGMVAMLNNLEDPSRIGPGMAVAFVATLYGAMVCFFLLGPLADKLGKRSEEEEMMMGIIIKEVMSIQSGDNPRIVEQKLMAFLPPKQRKKVDRDKKE